MHYFSAVIEELCEQPPNPDYLRYLQSKLATLALGPLPRQPIEPLR
jgi:hypothetical protein